MTKLLLLPLPCPLPHLDVFDEVREPAHIRPADSDNANVELGRVRLEKLRMAVIPAGYL